MGERKNLAAAHRGRYRYPIANVTCGDAIRIENARLFIYSLEELPCLEVRYGGDTPDSRGMFSFSRASVRQLQGARIGLVAGAVAYNALEQVTHADHVKSWVWVHQSMSSSAFPQATAGDLHGEWQLDLKPLELLVPLKRLGHKTGGWTCRLLREFSFTPPPIAGCIEFEDGYEEVLGTTRLFNITLPENMDPEDKRRFEAWCLMLDEDDVGTTDAPTQETRLEADLVVGAGAGDAVEIDAADSLGRVRKRQRSESLASPSKASLLDEFMRLHPEMSSDIQEKIQKFLEKQQAIQISSLTIRNIIERFSLNTEVSVLPPETSVLWDIEKEMPADLLDNFTIPPSALRAFQAKYMKIADRGSEEICRILVDVIIIEAIYLYHATVQKAMEAPPRAKTQPGGSIVRRSNRIKAASEQVIAESKTSADAFEVVTDEITRFRKLQKTWLTLVGEVAIEYENEGRETIYRGRLDYCVAIQIRGREGQSHGQSLPEPTPGEVIGRGGSRRPLFSVLAVVEAKTERTLAEARAQLLGYLAVLHESRKRRKRADTSVNGIATDGLTWIAYKINHKGTVTTSDPFNIRSEKGLANLIRVLVYLFTEGVKMSTPNSSPTEGTPDPDIFPGEGPSTIEEREEERE
ncbi:hypothetical protein Dda_1192 [Drechslerella dactyloides]|uniref:Uncharacterized protein n=1 Tax=Drechslerella dactyloides TaxID=74499 RepID=A0AAD6J6U2_DREDA|nr:hypothetical protein Dda_1192 [Drechslerella dactyloides]